MTFLLTYLLLLCCVNYYGSDLRPLKPWRRLTLVSVREASWQDARTIGVPIDLSPSSSIQPAGRVSLGVSNVFLSLVLAGLQSVHPAGIRAVSHSTSLHTIKRETTSR